MKSALCNVKYLSVSYALLKNSKLVRWCQSSSAFSSIALSSCAYEIKSALSIEDDKYLMAGDGKLSAVFDGHNGHQVAKILKHELPATFAQYIMPNVEQKTSSASLYTSNDTVVKALKDTLQEVNKNIHSNKDLREMGAAASVAYFNLHPTDASQSTVITANVGDSRIIVSHKGVALDLTQEHTPTLSSERERIEALGGTVKQLEDGIWKVQGKLRMSRAIGDAFLSPYVSNEPECKIHTIQENDEFIIVCFFSLFAVATHEFWEAFTSQQAVEYVHHLCDGEATHVVLISVCDIHHLFILSQLYDMLEDEEHRKQFYPFTNGVTDPILMRPTVRDMVVKYLVSEAVLRRKKENTMAVITWIDHNQSDHMSDHARE